jgi:hypothetical protein
MFLAEYGACRQRVANYGRIYGVLYQSCSPSRRDGIGERRFRNAVVHTSLTLMPCGVATNDECAIHDGVLGAISPVGCTFAAILSVRTDFTPVYTTPGTPASDKPNCADGIGQRLSFTMVTAATPGVVPIGASVGQRSSP